MCIRDRSYAASAATIGKTEQALKDIPQSVTVVTRKRIDDQNLATISEVLENTTGVTISEVADGGRNFYSRGFKISNIQYDGVPLSRSFYAVSYTHLDVYKRQEETRAAIPCRACAGVGTGRCMGNVLYRAMTADV